MTKSDRVMKDHVFAGSARVFRQLQGKLPERVQRVKKKQISRFDKKIMGDDILNLKFEIDGFGFRLSQCYIHVWMSDEVVASQ